MGEKKKSLLQENTIKDASLARVATTFAYNRIEEKIKFHSAGFLDKIKHQKESIQIFIH